MKRDRLKTKTIYAGSLAIGGDAPVSIQSMTNLPIEDIEGNVSQINRLKQEGADLVRVAVRNEDSIKYLKKIINRVNIPLSADIHFNHKIALKAIESGINKIRINPGNIGSSEKVKEVVKAARDHSVPIRIGVNGGSIDKKKYSAVNPESLVKSAMEHVKILEDNNFFDIVVSIKSSDVMDTIIANKLFSEKRNYPLHIGLTEAGYGLTCTVQSSIAIGHLLLNGIGDTIRVSMTGDPVEEVVTAKKILESVGDRRPVIKIISCPTCGRTDLSLDILELARSTESELYKRFGAKLDEFNISLTVAVMGCEVNGPGEAAHADFGVAGGRGGAMLLFAHGKKLRTIRKENAVNALCEEIDKSFKK